MTAQMELSFKCYYADKIYMTADVETGVLMNRSGRRMIALTNDFLFGLHRAIEKECGDRVQTVLYNCGRKWGINFGQGLGAAWSEFYETPIAEFPLAFFQNLLVQEFNHNGWGVLTLDYHLFAKGVILLTLDGAIMSDITPEATKYPTDVLTAGILSGLFTHFAGRDLGCIQTQVGRIANGNSRFLLSDPKRIAAVCAAGAAGKPHQEIVDAILGTQA